MRSPSAAGTPGNCRGRPRTGLPRPRGGADRSGTPPPGPSSPRNLAESVRPARRPGRYTANRPSLLFRAQPGSARAREGHVCRFAPVLRPGRLEDADAIAAVFVAARTEMTYLPRPDLLTMQRVFREHVMPRDEVQVAETDDRVVGFASLSATFLDHLYVHPDAQGGGLGKALLDWAKQQRPEGLELWLFQANVGARRFYERHGFRLAELTDGSENMERVPDARYVYP